MLSDWLKQRFRHTSYLDSGGASSESFINRVSGFVMTWTILSLRLTVLLTIWLSPATSFLLGVNPPPQLPRECIRRIILTLKLRDSIGFVEATSSLFSIVVVLMAAIRGCERRLRKENDRWTWESDFDRRSDADGMMRGQKKRRLNSSNGCKRVSFVKRCKLWILEKHSYRRDRLKCSRDLSLAHRNWQYLFEFQTRGVLEEARAVPKLAAEVH